MVKAETYVRKSDWTTGKKEDWETLDSDGLDMSKTYMIVAEAKQKKWGKEHTPHAWDRG